MTTNHKPSEQAMRAAEKLNPLTLDPALSDRSKAFFIADWERKRDAAARIIESEMGDGINMEMLRMLYEAKEAIISTQMSVGERYNMAVKCNIVIGKAEKALRLGERS